MDKEKWDSFDSAKQLRFLKERLSEQVILDHFMVFLPEDQLNECLYALADDYDLLEVE